MTEKRERRPSELRGKLSELRYEHRRIKRQLTPHIHQAEALGRRMARVDRKIAEVTEELEARGSAGEERRVG